MLLQLVSSLDNSNVMDEEQLSDALAARLSGVNVKSPFASKFTVVAFAEVVGPVTSAMVKVAAEDAALVLPSASCALK